MVEMLPGSSFSNPCLTVPFNAWGSTSLFHDMAAAKVPAKPEKAGRPPPRLSFFFPKADRDNETPPLDFAPIATNVLVVVISVVLSGFVMPYFSLPKEVAEIKTDLEVAKQGLSDQVKALDVRINAFDINVGKDLKALDAKVDTIRKDLSDLKERGCRALREELPHGAQPAPTSYLGCKGEPHPPPLTPAPSVLPRASMCSLVCVLKVMPPIPSKMGLIVTSNVLVWLILSMLPFRRVVYHDDVRACGVAYVT
ncbi:hypothetical protein HaLaN_31459, partial [Haematococcus lacustris]